MKRTIAANRTRLLFGCVLISLLIVYPLTVSAVEGKIPLALGSATPPLLITQSGSYVLTENFTGGIVITATNVELDLNGHTITNTATRTGILINNAGPVRIFNGNIFQGNKGINVVIDNSAVGHLSYSFESLSLLESNSRGIEVQVSIGPEVNVNIDRCFVRGLGGDGINLDGVKGGYISNNLITTQGIISGSTGIRVVGSSNVYLSHNVIGQEFTGIWISGTGNHITDNVLETFITGIVLDGTGNSVKNNDIRSSQEGILNSGGQSIIQHNNIVAATGIHVRNSSSAVQYNSVYGNSMDPGSLGILLENAGNTTVDWNTVVQNGCDIRVDFNSVFQHCNQQSHHFRFYLRRHGLPGY